ncbi:MAG: Crp/Fnr family transcriptional regulator [Chloroflexi bacterium]|nr:Crp/Fnr family transcriptional regulator [Chloroflexota bacterium]
MSEPNTSFTRFIEQLRESPFFGTFDEESLAFLVAQAKRTNHQAGLTIFREGEPSQGLYWLRSGTLKAVKYSISGKEQILHFIRSGQTFNVVGAFTTLPNPASVVALEPVQVWRIPRDIIRQRILQDPTFAQLIIDVLSKRLRQSVALIEDLSLRPVINRLSRLILDEAHEDTLFRPTWYTQYELAARLGTVTDVVQRSLRKLEADNLIEVDQQQIRIVNRIELEKLAA